jgi:hypothetical protein
VDKDFNVSKLSRDTLPAGHTKDDFKCCGPVAVKDGEFEGTCLADLACFNQEGKSNNKFYHGAVVESKINSNWYTYFEWGRIGYGPSYQFYECNSKAEAEGIYSKQLHEKNDKRGRWVDSSIGKILQAKPGKDCYLVRPQSVRQTGLPDARNISNSVPSVAPAVLPNSVSKSQPNKFDDESQKLINCLKLGTIEYTRNSMVDTSLPTKEAIDEARTICSEATKIINTKGQQDVAELSLLTRTLYSRIPRKVSRGQRISLSAELIQTWLQDLDAYESAINAASPVQQTQVTELGFNLRWLSPSDPIRKWVAEWFLNATRNVHSYISGKVKIRNIFLVEKPMDKFDRELKSIVKTDKEYPLHQPSERVDIPQNDATIYERSGTYMLFHGTRSVNVGGILSTGLRLPRTLSNVAINGAMFGSGIYCADDWKKSVGYTSYERGIWSGGAGGIKGRGAFMFIKDVVCGNMHIPTGSRGYTSPPPGSHTIYAKMGKSGVQNNEFITFNPERINLRYLVEFE